MPPPQNPALRSPLISANQKLYIRRDNARREADTACCTYTRRHVATRRVPWLHRSKEEDTPPATHRTFTAHHQTYTTRPQGRVIRKFTYIHDLSRHFLVSALMYRPQRRSYTRRRLTRYRHF